MEKEQWISWEAARSRLHISRDKMSKLVKRGLLGNKRHPLDNRKILIKEADVRELEVWGVDADPVIQKEATQ